MVAIIFPGYFLVVSFIPRQFSYRISYSYRVLGIHTYAEMSLNAHRGPDQQGLGAYWKPALPHYSQKHTQLLSAKGSNVFD